MPFRYRITDFLHIFAKDMAKRHRPDNDNEEELVEGLRQGCADSFGRLYALYHDRVFAYCLQISKSPVKATDITQEVFMKLWETRGSIQPCRSVSPLLFRIARNRLVSEWRDVVNSANYEKYVRYHTSVGAECHSEMEYEDFVRQVENCLTKMPRTQREVVEMSRFKAMSNKEIAAQLGLSEQTVKNRLVLGLKFLRTHLRTLAILSAASSAAQLLNNILQA